MPTTNKGLNQPVIGSTGWGTPLNDNFGYIDDAFGGVTTIDVTGVTATPVVLTQTQYQKLIIKFTGTLTANVTYQLPSGIGGKWVLRNNATGAFTVTFASLGGGTSFVATPGFANAASDGVNTAGNFDAIAAGIITMWSGSIGAIPSGWFLCDGTNGTPDLRDRFIVGAGSTYAVNATGGAATVTLTQAQTPAHTHGYGPANVVSGGTHGHGVNDPTHLHTYQRRNRGAGATPESQNGGLGAVVATVASGTGIFLSDAGSHAHNYGPTNTTSIGSSGSHENRPPYFALCYIRKA
jgi:microcystin-dependent protein